MINKDNSIKSKIIISCKKEGDKTLLENSFYNIPYKVSHYGKANAHKHLELIQMCASPGVMDGDSLELDVTCPDRTEMKLYTQSYNKIHPMPRKIGALQVATFKLGESTLFQYLPHPTIPFEQSIFVIHNTIHLDESSHLIWSDIIGGGRIFSGERFQFSKFHTKTKIFRNGRLLLYDNQLLEPANQPVEEILFFEGYTFQATFIVVSPYAMALKKELDEMLVEQFMDMTYGYTLCAENAIMMRGLGDSGDALHEWIYNMGIMCWEFIQYHRNKNASENITESKEPLAKVAEKGSKRKPAKLSGSKKENTQHVQSQKEPVAKKTVARKGAKKPVPLEEMELQDK